MDPPGVDKHLRFEPGTRELANAHAELLKGFSGVKAIVLHIRGKKGEHPHLHVWWESDISGGVTNQTVKNHLKAYNAVFSTYSGQQMWSMRNHDNYEAWSNYVTANGSHVVMLGDEDLIALSVKAKMLIAAQPLSPEPVRVIVKKPTSEERLMRYCETEMNWVRGDHFHLGHGTAYWQKHAKRAVVSHTNNRLNNAQLQAQVRNVMYVFGDDEVKEYFKEHVGDNINFF